MYLVVDIGGTKIEMAWAIVREQVAVSEREIAQNLGAIPLATVELQDLQKFATEGIHTFAPFAGNYLRDRKPSMVVIGVAGPVFNRKVKLTNLPFEIDADQIEEELGCPTILVNDLEAHGWGVSFLGVNDVETIQEGQPRLGNRALIAAGTGLGEAILFWDGEEFRPSSSEGGHCTFAPSSLEDLEFMRFMLSRYDHVSWERVVSGIDGFRDIFSYLYHTSLIKIDSSTADEVLAAGPNMGPLLTKKAHEGLPWAIKTVEWFVRFYGAEAGNLALKSMAFGGIYIGGSIIHHIMPWVQKGLFVEAFLAKGRFRSLLEKIPIRVIKDPYSALKGAGLLGHRLFS
jgi:glucokinase